MHFVSIALASSLIFIVSASPRPQTLPPTSDVKPQACLSAAQAIPTCGRQCLEQAAISVGCGVVDFTCSCPKQSAVANAATSCVIKACPGISAAEAVQSAAQAVCSCVSQQPAGADSSSSSSSSTTKPTPPPVAPAQQTSPTSTPTAPLASKQQAAPKQQSTPQQQQTPPESNNPSSSGSNTANQSLPVTQQSSTHQQGSYGSSNTGGTGGTDAANGGALSSLVGTLFSDLFG